MNGRIGKWLLVVGCLLWLCLWSGGSASGILSQPEELVSLVFDQYLDLNHDGVLNEEELAVAIASMHEPIPDGTNEDENGDSNHLVLSTHLQAVLEEFDINEDGHVTAIDLLHKLRPFDHPLPQPDQVHLSLTSNPSEMNVMWLTQHQVDSIVEYGTSSSNLSYQATGSSHSYSVPTIFGEYTGVVHQVTLTGLEYGKRYYYRAGSSVNWTTIYEFDVENPVAADATTVVAMVGDMGTFIPYGFKVSKLMYKQFMNGGRFNFTMHAGDVAYAGTSDKREWEWIWRLFLTQVQPYAARAPYMIAVGNHEKYYDYRAFRNRFYFPGNHSLPINSDNGNLWYSFDYGSSHFTIMSTEHDYNEGSPQYNFLKNDLHQANENRDQTPWIIVVGHRPMYCSDKSEYASHNGNSSTSNLQAQLEPLFHQYGVDMMHTGHMHMYERTFPVYNGVVAPENSKGNQFSNPNATFYIVQGNSGVFLDFRFINPVPSWSAIRYSKWGYGRVTTNQTSLHYELIDLSTEDVADECWIFKPTF